MRVLLIGDFSGLHLHLATGLRELGHEAVVSATGDAFKKIGCDHALCDGTPGLKGLVSRATKPLFDLPYYRTFDIVQFIAPEILGNKRWHRFLSERLRRACPRSFVLGCGDDPIAFHGMLAGDMRYSWIAPMLRDRGPGEDLARVVHDLLSTQAWLRATEEAQGFTGAIPLSYEYALGYSQLSNALGTVVPFPFASESTPAQPWPDGPLVFFHGVNRPTFKGTPLIREAFARVEQAYPGLVRCVIAERMPLAEYKKALAGAHVVVDQCHSYSYAMNALTALAMSKVVMSGAEPECLAAWGIPAEDCPVVNLEPRVDAMVAAMAKLIENRAAVKKLAEAGPAYVKKHHEARTIALKFLELWNRP